MQFIGCLSPLDRINVYGERNIELVCSPPNAPATIQSAAAATTVSVSIVASIRLSYHLTFTRVISLRTQSAKTHRCRAASCQIDK